MCSEDCKCRVCERRGGGQPSMLKTTPSAAARSRPPASTSRNLLMDSSSQIRADASPLSESPDKWHDFVNGGARADDARLLQKRREEEAAFEEARRRNGTPRSVVGSAADADAASGSARLIETSSRKPAPSLSANANLLVDLDINSEYGDYIPQPTRLYASAARTTRSVYGGSEYNLLD